MGGLDAVVFTGGIGERSPLVRARICDGLRVVGALLHERKNGATSTAERDLSTMDSRVRILVIPTDEEKAIAMDVRRILEGPADTNPMQSDVDVDVNDSDGDSDGDGDGEKGAPT